MKPVVLKELGVTISLPADVGFVAHVDRGLDVITAPAPNDQIAMFAMVPGHAGLPCEVAKTLRGDPVPVQPPHGWTRGSGFRKGDSDTLVFCADVRGGQLTAVLIRSSSASLDQHLEHPWSAVFASLRAQYGADAPRPVTAPVAGEPATTSAPAEVPTPEPVGTKKRKRPTLGYRAYEGAFYDIRFGFESAPWASPDGKTSMTLGGVHILEHRGLTINIVMLIISLGGAAGRPHSRVIYTDYRGNQYVNAAAETKARDEYIKSVTAGAATQPFSLDLRGYHDSMGSEMNGLSMALLVSWRAGEDGVRHFGVEGGHLATNRNYVPPADPTASNMEFSRGWLGVTYDHRRRLYQKDSVVVGLHGHALLALSDPWIGLVTIGPELTISDRLHVALFASQDLHRFDFSNGIGWRAELGVRF
ncbi:MAG: hypothetical protein H0T46_34050 [Deltaproteobacteria bacterium]|nr:hypothetical protein [Deltaproteobacteria bacterium]